MKFMMKIFFLIILLVISSKIYAEPLALDSSHKQPEILEDPSKSLTFQQILTDRYSDQFKPHTGKRLNFGRTLSAWWARFQVETNQDQNPWYLLLDSHIGEELDLYIIPADNRETVAKPERWANHAEPIRNYHRHAWRIQLPADTQFLVYLRVTNGGAILDLPIRVLSEDAFLQSSIHYYLIVGSLYAAMLVLALYQLLMYLSLREKGYLIFASNIVLLVLSLHRINPVLPQLDFLGKTGAYFFSLPTILAIVTGYWFIRVLLHTREYAPRIDFVFRFLMILTLACGAFIGAVPGSAVLLPNLGALLYASVFISSLYLFLKGHKIALYIAIAYGTSIVFLITTNWWVNTFNPREWETRNDLMVSASNLLVIFILAWAQAERVRMLRENARQHEIQHKAKDELLATMSHELRTPIHAISGLTGLLKLTPLNEKQQDYIDRLAMASQHQSQLVNNLLDLAKFNNQKIHLEQKPFRLDVSLHAINALMEPLAKQKNLSYHYRAESDIAQPVMGDRIRLTQVLLNLLTNAIKYTQYGQVELIITAQKTSTTHCRLQFHIQDTGMGIPKDQQHKLFEPFNQLGNRNDGAGLGLAICKKLVDAMQGTIEVYSQIDKGSCFSVTLPMPFAQNPELQTYSNTPGKEEHLPAGLRILFVDDSEINCFIGAEVLMNMGAEYVTAHGGEVAILALQQQDFDLVMTDISMPDIDGLQLTQWIRRHSRNTHIPVIALTAHATDTIKQAAFRSGINALLTKPFTPADIFQVIQETLAADREIEQAVKPAE